MSKHGGTGYSLVAELTWGMPNGEIPCGSIRMVSQWDGIPCQLSCFNIGTWAHEKLRESVTYPIPAETRRCNYLLGVAFRGGLLDFSKQASAPLTTDGG